MTFAHSKVLCNPVLENLERVAFNMKKPTANLH